MKIDKLIRFVVIEHHFKYRCGMFIVFLIALVILSQILAGKKVALKKAGEDKVLVESIPRMEKLIEMSSRPKPTPRKEPAAKDKLDVKTFVLQGISYFEDIPYAVINDEIYKVGDLINNHSVYEIKDDHAVLKHRFTGAIKEIYLKPFEDGEALP